VKAINASTGQLPAAAEAGLAPVNLNAVLRRGMNEAGLLDLRSRHGLYSEYPHGVEINGGVLYRAVITIPSQVPVGTYTAETFLIDRHKVIAAANRDIQIDKSGFERYVALAARRNRLLYGLTCVFLSLFLGWAAAAVFRRRF